MVMLVMNIIICVCVCSYFNAERTKFIGNGMIMNPLTYKHVLNSRNSSTLKQISKFIGIIFSKFVWKILTEM